MIAVIVVAAILAVLFAVWISNRENGSIIDALPDIRHAEPGVQAKPSEVQLASLLPEQFIVLDLETTGLSPRTDEIIEIGAIKFTLGKDDHPAFQTLVKPKTKLSRKIIEITGITDSMLEADGISMEAALRRFLEFAGELPIVTYNAEFDMGFILTAAQRCGLTISNKYACALKRARRAWPELPSHKLSYVAEVMGASSDNQHRALGDARRTVTVFCVSTVKLGQKVRWTKPSVI